MRLLLVGFLAIGACVQSDAVTCDNGKTCPPNRACDREHDTCVLPSQLMTCASLDDGQACSIEELPGVCDKHVCIPAGCGDGYRQDPELCDATDRGTGNCTDFGFYDSKTPLCNTACSYDTSNCTGFCGDGKVTEGFEICEDTIAPTDTCVDYGYGAGVLGCSACGPGFATCKSFAWDIVQGLVSPPQDVHGLADNDIYAAIGNASVEHFDGTAWSVVDLSACADSNDSIKTVWQVAPGVMFAAGDAGFVLRYMNGTCQSWTTNGGAGANLDVWASSASDAWVAGYGGIWHFNGADWTQSSPENALSIWGASSTNVYATTSGGQLMRFTGTWSSPASVTPFSNINTVWGASATDMYIAGVGAASHALVAHSSNGTAWTPILENEPLLNAGASSVVNGYTVGARTVVTALRYSSATEKFVLEYDGQGWANLKAPIVAVGGLGFTWMSPTGRVIVPSGLTAGLSVYTGNVRIDHPDAFPSINGAVIEARAQNDAWLASGDELFHWNGYNWTPTSISARDVSIAPDGTVFAQAAGAGLTKVGTAGQDTSVPGYRVAALAANDVWILDTGQSQVYRWTAPGSHTNAPYTSQYTMNDIWGVAPSTVFLVGEHGVILQRTGTTWTSTQTSTTTDLYQVWGNGPTDVFAVGNQVVLHFNGTAWSELPAPPATGVRTVWGTTQDLFVGGNEGLFHFDGTQWTPVDSGAPFFTSAVSGSGDSVFWLDYTGQPHQLVRTSSW